MKKFFFSFSFVALTAAISFAGPNDSDWIQLLRKGDTALSDWRSKVQGFDLGQNPNRSFTYAEASDGSPRLIVTDTVTYNATTYGYGHLFYKTPFSDYIVRAQFHFPSKTSFASGQGTWTIQNNGLMLHCQNPTTVAKTKDYPNCIENQLLGYWSQAAATPPASRSSNLCVPGVTVYYNNGATGSNGTGWYSDGSGHHCTNAKVHSLTYDSSASAVKGANSTNATWLGKDIWQYAMARVLDTASMTFWVRSRPDTAWDSVMAFTRIHLGNASSTTNLGSATPLDSGWIALQMEGTSTEFAKIEVLNLKGCMTTTDLNYKSYFVKNDPAACGLPVNSIKASQILAGGVFSLVGNRIEATSEIINVEVFDLNGVRVASFGGAGQSFMDVVNLKPGLYSLRVKTRNGSAQAVYAKM